MNLFLGHIESFRSEVCYIQFILKYFHKGREINWSNEGKGKVGKGRKERGKKGKVWKVKVKLLSRVWLFVTPWTVAHQAPPSMGFSRQSTGVGCHFLLQKEKYSTMLIFGKYGLWKYSAVIVVFFWFFYMLAIYQNKEWNNAICSNVGGLGDCCTWWNKSDKDKYHVISLVVESLVDEPIYKSNRLTDLENKLMVTKRERGER